MNRAFLGLAAGALALACGSGSQGASPDGGPDATADGSADSGPVDAGAAEASAADSGAVDTGALSTDAGPDAPGAPEAGPACSQGAVQCSNNGVQTCGPDGQWAAPSPCVNQTCASGACTGVCAPNQAQCSGSQLQTCDTAGQWGTPVACPGTVTCQQGSCCPIPVAQTTRGPVQGQISGDGACAYLGVPYAAPPVGGLRWKAPQPAASWTPVRPSALAPTCPQSLRCGPPPSTSSEDCLYLNVWTPPALTTAAPVMVYVHGGSFDLGCSAGFQGGGGLAVGNLAAEQGVVVMTMDYRLGPLGFLSLPELRAEDPAHPSAGNYGIEDQIAALQWVKQNAAAFGGDPTNVTIFGESAGGISMYVHLASPKSAGLFQRVIVSDGYSAYNDLFALNQATADQAGAAFVSPFDCNPGELLSCLRGTSVADLIASEGSYSIAPYGYSWLPVVDGFVLPADPAVLLGAGTFNKVPTLFQVATNQPNNSDNLSCPTLHSARACASAGVPTFLTNLTYAFNDPPDLPTVPYDGEQTLFVFDNAANTGISFTPQEQLLGQQIRAYWASMAATGNPNGGGRFPWPAFDLSTEQNLVLDTTLTTQTALRVGAICGLPAQDGGTSDAASE